MSRMFRRALLGLFLLVAAAIPASAQFNGCVAGFCSSSSQWVFPGATLDLDFANNRYFGVANGINSLTVSRASSGYAEALDGTWVNFGNNIARRTDRGLLVEESRTNSIRNNSMQGAVAGSPGTLPTNWSGGSIGLNRSVVGTGTLNGIDYVDVRFSGTTSSQHGALFFENSTIIAATTGQTFANSAFAALVGGNLNGLVAIGIRFDAVSSGGVQLSSHASTALKNVLTSNFVRYSSAGTPTNPSTSYVVPLLYFSGVNASGDAIDFTIRIGWPQLELGAFATSPIRTMAAAATRAADFITFPVGGWYNSIEGALFAEGSPYAGVLGTPAVLQIGTSTNRIITSLPGVGSNSSPPAAVITSSVTQTAFTNVIGVSPAKSALAYATNNFGAAYNGALQTDNVGSLPSVGATVYLGTNSSGSFYSGYIERIAYFPRRLSNTELQSLTQ